MTHYIYIHGFGDSYNWLRRIALRRWNSPGMHVTLVPMNWKSKTETFEQKYERIAKLINTNEETVLVGESAGGAMALLAYMRRYDHVQALVTVCGYNHSADNIGQQYRRANPAFYPLVQEVDRSLPELIRKEHISILQGKNDSVVAAKYGRIAGAREMELPTRGHFASIGYVLLKGPDIFAEKVESHGV